MKQQMLVGVALSLLMVSGCSSVVRMPWEKEPLDANRIATREPLEIPPDLRALPVPETDRPDSTPQDARAILFGSPARSEKVTPLGRNEKETLPDWIQGNKTPTPAANTAKPAEKTTKRVVGSGDDFDLKTLAPLEGDR